MKIVECAFCGYPASSLDVTSIDDQWACRECAGNRGLSVPERSGRDCNPSSGPGLDYLPDYGVWWPLFAARNPHQIEYHMTHRNGWEAAADRCPVKRTVIQAGGFVGLWAAGLSEAFQTVYTFEPHPNLFPCLVLNAPAMNVIKTQAALGNRTGRVDLRFQSMGSHQVMPHDTGRSLRRYPMVRIDDLRLDDLDLLLLDVEGFEYFVLLGAVETIQRCRPVIQLERVGLETRFNVSPYVVETFMSNIGYRAVQHVGDDTVYVYGGHRHD